MSFKGKNSYKKRIPAQRQDDITFCTRLFLRGVALRKIAEELNKRNAVLGRGYTVTWVSVWQDLRAIMVEWKREHMNTIEEYVLIELKKLDAIEVEAWEAWEKSKTVKERKKMKPAMDGDNALDCVELVEETTAGDPRFLDMLLNVQRRRAKLLGLDAPTRIDLVKKKNETEDPSYSVKSLPQELLFAVADKLQEAESEKQKQLKNGETVHDISEESE